MKTIVFYDGRCSLCAKEIRYYQKISPVGLFNFIDITTDNQLFKQYHQDVKIGLKQLHVLDTKGVMQVGVDAFITIWGQLRYWRMLALIANLPGIHWFLSVGYRLFAAWRFKKNGYNTCQF